jgi:pyroglutamyl-peptidase
MSGILLTGFEPFGGESTNPSWQAVVLAATLWSRQEALSIAELPTEFARSSGVLDAAIAASQPDVVLCVGQAGGIRTLELERVAINLDDARIPDNAGDQPIDVPAFPDATAAHFTTVPVKRGLAALTAAGLPATLSLSAGTYVCNHTFFHLLDTHPRGGFLHIPYAPGQVGAGTGPTMSVETVAEALVILAETYLDHVDDLVVAGGTLN